MEISFCAFFAFLWSQYFCDQKRRALFATEPFRLSICQNTLALDDLHTRIELDVEDALIDLLVLF